MKMGARRLRRDGVSLIEVIVALLIFSLCVGGICRLISMGRQGSDEARAHYTAINIAKNQLERIKTYDFDQIELFAESNVDVNRSGVPTPDADFRRTTQVSLVTNDLKEVVVRVDIRNKVSRQFDGKGQTVQTYIADYIMYGAE